MSRGIMSGTSDTTFSPSTAITRAQFLLSLSKCLGIILDNYVNTGFTDVPVNKYYTGAVKWATDNDILDPLTSTTFSPSTVLTREMAANAMINYCVEYSVDYPIIGIIAVPSDCTSLSSESISNIQKAIYMEFLSLDSSGNFNPTGTVSRGQAAVIFSNLFEYYLDSMAQVVMPLFDSRSVTWTPTLDNGKLLFRWWNKNLTSKNHYAATYLDDGMDYFNESGYITAYEGGSLNSSNVIFSIPTSEEWEYVGGNDSTIAICVPVNSSTPTGQKITTYNYRSITNRNIVQAYIYFHPDHNSIYWDNIMMNVPKVIAHEAFHTLGFGHIGYDHYLSIMNTGNAVFNQNITHLQQYDYLCLKSKY